MVKWTIAMLAAAVLTLKNTVDGLEHEKQRTRSELRHIKNEVKKGRTLRKQVKKKKKAASARKAGTKKKDAGHAGAVVAARWGMTAPSGGQRGGDRRKKAREKPHTPLQFVCRGGEWMVVDLD